MQFKTTAAYLSGGVCGHMWMPQAMAGKPLRKNARGPWGFMDHFTEPCTFEEALSSLLMNEGGDFQDARFTADTVIVIERRAIDGQGKYRMHIKEVQLIELCPDLVNEDAYTGDFMGDDE